jgi:hypothetical protein
MSRALNDSQALDAQYNQVLEGKIQGGVFKAPLTFTATNERTSVM